MKNIFVQSYFFTNFELLKPFFLFFVYHTMFKTTGIILLCMTFIFATSGNSRGLIFKNLAKTEHELKVKNDFGMPAAEEIFEQVTEKKPPTSILKFPYFPIEQRDMLHLNYFLNRSILLHINDIVIPPPKF